MLQVSPATHLGGLSPPPQSVNSVTPRQLGALHEPQRGLMNIGWGSSPATAREAFLVQVGSIQSGESLDAAGVMGPLA